MKLFLHSFHMLILLLMGSLSVNVQASEEVRIKAERQQELLHLLKQDCGSCHGLALKGGLGPALLPENLKGKPESYLTYTILNGRPGTAMPPWRALLKPVEAKWLANVLLRGDLK